VLAQAPSYWQQMVACSGGHEGGGGAHPRTIFPVGERLSGIYEIRGLLGEGGMGQVFEAHDHHLNRESAVKAYWPVTGAITAGLVRREGQALAAIHHPNLATVFTMGRHLGIDYLVMERIRGVGLDVEMAQRHRIKSRVPMRDTIRVLLAMADALKAVHAAGCLHRDVKPGNVMLTARERVVLMDFGLFVRESELAGHGDLAGSPSYIAPEVILDRVRPGSGHLVDFYALGVIAFELLTGRLPFVGKSLSETLEMQVNVPLPDLAVLAPGAPPKLSALTRDLLAKDPDERPDAEEVLWRLRAVREDFESAPRRALTPIR
jgi:eukaryotic-like serine/threonine-protein kinase